MVHNQNVSFCGSDETLLLHLCDEMTLEVWQPIPSCHYKFWDVMANHSTLSFKGFMVQRTSPRICLNNQPAS
eukprot:343132-Amphidinium_carterae.2